MLHFRKTVIPLLCFCLVVLAAGRLYRLLAELAAEQVETTHVATRIKRRWDDFLRNLERIDVQGKEVVIFFGHSDVELGLDPAEVLRMAGRPEAEGFNLGFPVLPARIIPLLLERSFRELRSRGASEIVLVMKTPVFSLTPESSRFFQTQEIEDILLTIADLQSFMQGILGSPVYSLDLFLKKLILGTASSWAIEYWLNSVVFASPHYRTMERYHAVARPRESYQEGHWPLSGRGKIPWESAPRPEPDASSEEFAVSVFERLYGLGHPRLSQEGRKSMLSASRWAREHGVETVLFHFPTVIAIEGKVEAHGLRSQQEIIEFTAEAFGARVLELRPGESWSRADFIDLMHLNEKGEEKMWRALGEALRESWP